MLRDAGSPVKTDELQKKCNVPKKRLNQVLYQMKKKQLVVHLDLATWGSSGDASGEVVPTEPAGPSQGNFPSWGAAGRGGGWNPAHAVLATGKPGCGPGFE